MNIDSQAWRQRVIEGARVLGVAVTDEQAGVMGRHVQELLLWNRATNLTAITDPMEAAVKHCVDAVAAAPWIGRSARVLDAGSGGGFPGIPLNIVRPDLGVTLVDSVRKKVSFLKHAIRTLELSGIDAVHGRLEDLGRLPDYAGRFQVVVCRAFASLEGFVERTASFLGPGGALLAMKGPQVDGALGMLQAGDEDVIVLGGRRFRMRIHRYDLPFLDSQRSLIRLTPLAGER